MQAPINKYNFGWAQIADLKLKYQILNRIKREFRFTLTQDLRHLPNYNLIKLNFENASKIKYPTTWDSKLMVVTKWHLIDWVLTERT